MNRRRRFVVTGLTGQVAQSLAMQGAARHDVEVVAIGRPDLDLSKPECIAKVIEAARPDVIVSAAAYTAVDLAEGDEDAACIINATAPGELARVAKALKVPIVHLSTDYVFDGRKSEPYVESDPVAPLGAYGRSKLGGERLVASMQDDHVILRTAWIYSPFGKNFLRTMLRAAQARTELGVVDDQIGNPTSAIDFADAILKVGHNLLNSTDPALRGLFHLTGTGDATWADFAEEIFAISGALGGVVAKVARISTSDYPTAARRPINSRLNCNRIGKCHDIALPDWRVSAAYVVQNIAQDRFKTECVK